ncbi:MAG: NADH:flavin oxidoreductase [Proteobacteria bacterium]|nr:NADH:flavin oxidoreductase [Pseudomonadota bacterium]
MSVLFTDMKIGSMQLKNRFVHSATYECMASSNGEVTEKLIKRYTQIAKGGVGLIIPGYLFVMPSGRSMEKQTGAHSDGMIEGLKQLVDAIHANGSKVAFQLVHSGRQTSKEMIGQTPIAPSKGPRDKVFLSKYRKMTEGEIGEVIKAFGNAASRARKAGADGVQVHAAHGYLVNQFLSPFFNKRKDSWGGSDENRFRFLKEVVLEIRKNISDEMSILVKLNTHDHTPKSGITFEIAKKYSAWLADLPIDGLELSCGTVSYSMFNLVRGDVPTQEIIISFPLWKKILGKMMFKGMEGKFSLEEGYNLEAAKQIKPVVKDMPLIVVGGLRKVAHMEQIVKDGAADFISMCRPFIREPGVVNKIRQGKIDAVTCISCNKCFAAAASTIPVRCYRKGFPESITHQSSTD